MQHTYRDRSDTTMTNVVVAGVIGATVATVATALANKENRKRLREAYEHLMDQTADLRDLASRAANDVEDEARGVKTKVRKQANQLADKIEDAGAKSKAKN